VWKDARLGLNIYLIWEKTLSHYALKIVTVVTAARGLLKGSYDVAKNNIIFCIWCKAMFKWLEVQKPQPQTLLFSTYFTLLLLLYALPFWPTSIFNKAHRFEKRVVLWLASYPVHCDWPNTSNVWWKCYAPYHVVMPCPGAMGPKQ